jgi:hypothetical protein
MARCHKFCETPPTKKSKTKSYSSCQIDWCDSRAGACSTPPLLPSKEEGKKEKEECPAGVEANTPIHKIPCRHRTQCGPSLSDCYGCCIVRLQSSLEFVIFLSKYPSSTKDHATEKIPHHRRRLRLKAGSGERGAGGCRDLHCIGTAAAVADPYRLSIPRLTSPTNSNATKHPPEEKPTKRKREIAVRHVLKVGTYPRSGHRREGSK